MRRAFDGLSMRSKLLLVVGCSFVLASAAVIFVADRIMTAKANEQGRQLCAERLDSVFGLLQRKQDLLSKTGMEAAYRDALQESARTELASRFYDGHNLTAYPYILDADGRVVLHPSLKAGDEAPVSQSLAKKIQAAKSGECEYEFAGTPKWCMYRSFSPWNWTVVYAMSLRERYEAIYRFRTTVLAIMGSTALVVMGILAGLVSMVAKPIRQLTLATSRMAAGDLDQKVDTKRRDEIGALAHSFAELGNAIRTKIRKLDGEIAERQQAQERLREKTAFLEAQVEACIDGILIVDENSRWLLKNQRFIDIMQIPSDIAASSDDSLALEHVMHRVANSEQFLQKVQDLYAHRDRTSRDEVELCDGVILDRYSSPVVGPDGRYYGRIWTFRDVTEQRKAREDLAKLNRTLEMRVEERTADLTAINQMLQENIRHREQAEMDLQNARQAAEAANVAKSNFLAHMSHEIRTPLNGVVGMTDLLCNSGLTAEQTTYAELAKASADALLNLVNDILDFSKIEAGKVELERIDFELHGTVENSLTVLTSKASSKKLALGSFVDARVPTHLIGDPDRLRQILLNLLNNAIKFTERGSVTLQVSVEQDSGEMATLRFAVVDTGIGIPQDRLDRLFKSFSQADSSTTREFGGTGLGLAISKQLAQLMGGRMGVETEQGKGSTFWVSIPFRKGTPAISVRPLISDPNLRDLRILVLSHQEMLRETLCKQLAAWSMRGTAVSTAGQALAALRNAASGSQSFAMVLVDEATPADEQRSLMQTVRHDSQLRPTAMVILTSVEKPVSAESLKDSGFIAQVPKPVRQSQLFDQIMNALAVVAAPSAAPLSSVVATPASVAVRRQARILLAEDNVVNQKVAGKNLERAGYEYDVANNGQEAVDMVLRTSYDLVLMDCQMPGIDGFEATKLIRQAAAQGRLAAGRSTRLPIIALTANAIKGDREICLQAGMDGYLTKPLNPRELVQAIDAALAGAQTPPSEAAAAAQPAPANFETLLKNCSGEMAFIAELLGDFKKQAATDLVGIERAMADHDADGLRRAAHSLKGAAGYFSAGPLRDLAEKIEQAGRDHMLENVEDAVVQVRREFEACVAFIESCVNANAPLASARQEPA